MIPPFNPNGLLPPGVHRADDFKEIFNRFGTSRRRRQLLAQLQKGLENLRDAGCSFVLLDGSFVTDKQEPNDIDGCWEFDNSVDLTVLDPSFLLQTFKDRIALLADYGMDFFIAGLIESGSGLPFAEFFQQTPDGGRKGIVRLDLSTL